MEETGRKPLNGKNCQQMPRMTEYLCLYEILTVGLFSVSAHFSYMFVYNSFFEQAIPIKAKLPIKILRSGPHDQYGCHINDYAVRTPFEFVSVFGLCAISKLEITVCSLFR